jgi:hypothetical protein
VLSTLIVGCSSAARGSGDARALDEVSAADLFDEPLVCHTSGAEPPAHRAELSEQAAHAKMQRYPFKPRDGVQAVSFFREAALCWKAAARPERRRRVARQAESWKMRIWHDFLAQRLRLDLSLESGQPARALVEVRALQALWPRETDRVANELRRQEMRLRRMLDPKKADQ